MGAVAVSIVTPSLASVDGRRAVVADVTMSSSYATGGDTLTPQALGLQHVDEIYMLGGVLARGSGMGPDASAKFTPNSHGIQLVLAGSILSPKLQAFSGATSEVAAATNLSTRGTARIEFRGI